MWAKTFEKFERENQEKGRALGRKEGWRAGEAKGEAKILLFQLERKFGRLDRPTRARISKADSKQLLEWAERILTAERLEQVFEG